MERHDHTRLNPGGADVVGVWKMMVVMVVRNDIRSFWSRVAGGRCRGYQGTLVHD